MEDKIMAGGNLEEIMGRMIGCHAVLEVIHKAAGESTMADAIAGAVDLMRSIYMDFEADVSCAEDYTPQAAE